MVCQSAEISPNVVTVQTMEKSLTCSKYFFRDLIYGRYSMQCALETSVTILGYFERSLRYIFLQ